MALGIIGGTGVYDPKLLENSNQIKVSTPYGMTSDLITTGVIKGKKVVIIPRHGSNHFFNPSNVPYRANIWAMKELGVKKIISVSAVGSLKEALKPGHLVITNQFIDRTTKRNQTFYETGRICHISVADPFCNQLRQLLNIKAKELNLACHEKGTCVVIEGPRFSTKAESNLFRSWGADTVNMTLCPEVVLAREAEICYANIAAVTDYDVWHENPVSNEMVLQTMKKNIEKIQKLLMTIIPEIDETTCSCNKALENAMM